MHVPGLLSLLLSSALASTPEASATPKPSRTPATELQLEVVEHGDGKPSSFGFVVPLEGAVEAWIDRGDDPRRCEVKAHPSRDRLQIELRCEGSRAHALQVEAVRALSPGKRTRLAEVTRPGGATSQVFVTLR